METIYPKEYFYIQIYFAKRIVKIEDISFEEAIQDYTYIAKDLLGISEYPPSAREEWKGLFLLDEAKSNSDTNLIAEEWYKYYTKLPCSKWEPVEKESLKYGMFSYSFYPNEETVNIHAGNVRRGEEFSSFASKYNEENRKDLYRLIRMISKEYPKVKVVRCSSWINIIRGFVELFPEEYKKSLVVQDRNSFLGIWQQFLDKDGKVKKDLMREFCYKVDRAICLRDVKQAFPCKVIMGEVSIDLFLDNELE